MGNTSDLSSDAVRLASSTLASPTIRKVHGPYLRKDGRKHVVVVYEDLTKRTVSYPKWLVEQELGINLAADETIDHKDKNKTNDDIRNLQILTRSENAKKSVLVLNDVLHECSWCKVEFKLSPTQVAKRKTRFVAGPFCSRSCSGKYGKYIQEGGTPFSKVIPKRTYVSEDGIIVEKDKEVIQNNTCVAQLVEQSFDKA